jgi:hypothetical protein
MRKHVLALLAATALASVAVPAAAQAVNERQADIEQRIDTGIRNGALTQAEAARLRAELREIANIEARYRRDGNLSAAERIDLDRRLNQLSQSVRTERTDQQSDRGWVGVNQRQAQLERRIDNGVRTGPITRAEAARLRAELRQIAMREQQYRRSGGSLTTWERQDLDRRFDELSRSVREERNDRDDRGWVGINQRQAQLERRIDNGVRTGAITRAEAVRLRSEFRRIDMLEQQYRRSGGGLTQWERQDLDRRFDELSRSVREDRNDRDHRGWESINQRQAALDRRIEAGIRSGSLTRNEADKLRYQYREIVALEATYRRTEGRLTARERQDLDQRFDELSRRIRDERRDGQTRN